MYILNDFHFHFCNPSKTYSRVENICFETCNSENIRRYRSGKPIFRVITRNIIVLYRLYYCSKYASYISSAIRISQTMAKYTSLKRYCQKIQLSNNGIGLNLVKWCWKLNEGKKSNKRRTNSACIVVNNVNTSEQSLRKHYE